METEASATSHSSAVAVGRQPGTGKGRTATEVTDGTTPQTPKLQQSLTLGQNQQKMNCKVENEFHVYYEPRGPAAPT